MSDAPHLRAGRSGEAFVRRWLEAHGLRHICSNFRCRYGELDLVMRERDCIVIVEVRYRARNDYGGALPSILPAKLQRIAKAIQFLLQQHRQLREMPLRFDVIALAGPLDKLTVTWCKRACSFDDVE